MLKFKISVVENMNISVKEKDSAKIMIGALHAIEDEIGSALETLEIISDKETLESIERGVNDIKNKKVISFDEFLKKHGR